MQKDKAKYFVNSVYRGVNQKNSLKIRSRVIQVCVIVPATIKEKAPDLNVRGLKFLNIKNWKKQNLKSLGGNLFRRATSFICLGLATAFFFLASRIAILCFVLCCTAGFVRNQATSSRIFLCLTAFLFAL